MKQIKRSKTFEKHFRLRISPNQKLKVQFAVKLGLFMAGRRDYPLNDHPLTGKLKGKRGFSVANDMRVVYIENDKEIIFLDIGSHNQVYK